MAPIMQIESPVSTPKESTAHNWYRGGYPSISPERSESEEHALLMSRAGTIRYSGAILIFTFPFRHDSVTHHRRGSPASAECDCSASGMSSSGRPSINREVRCPCGMTQVLRPLLQVAISRINRHLVHNHHTACCCQHAGSTHQTAALVLGDGVRGKNVKNAAFTIYIVIQMI